MDSSSTAQHHHQETLESMLICTKSQQEKKPRPADQQALKCPRCESTNTKFCYYNNYSLSQPRYFCKSCRRYWTKGGTLRNVPVGGGCRKNKRSSSSSSSSSSSKRTQDHFTTIPTQIPNSYTYDSNDLNLAIARLHRQTSGGQLGLDDHQLPIWGNPNQIGDSGNNTTSSVGLFDSFRTGFLENHSHGLQNFYYGMGMGQGTGGNGISYHHEDFNTGATTTSTAVTTVKQEMCNATKPGGENRVLWGFPWQEEEFDSGRVSWNGIGLLNSPLM